MPGWFYLTLYACALGVTAWAIIYFGFTTRPPVKPLKGEWDFEWKACGNCEHWPLNLYYAARASEGGRPDGQGGTNCDGSMSDCRATLPGSYEWPGHGVIRLHPQVKRDHYCAHFKQREWSTVEERAQ